MNMGSYIVKEIETGATTPEEIDMMHAGIDEYVLTQVARGRISLEEANQMAASTNVMSDGNVFYHEEPTEDGGRTFWFVNNSLTWMDSWRKADQIEIRIGFDKDGNLRSISDRTLSFGSKYQYEDYLCENTYTTDENGIQTIQSTTITVEYSDDDGPNRDQITVGKCRIESATLQKTEGSRDLPVRIQSDVKKYDADELYAAIASILKKCANSSYKEADRQELDRILANIDDIVQSPVFDGQDLLHAVEPADTATVLKQSIKNQTYNALEDLRVECITANRTGYTRTGTGQMERANGNMVLPPDLESLIRQVEDKYGLPKTPLTPLEELKKTALKDRTADAVQRAKEKSGQGQKPDQNKDIRNAQGPQK